MTNVQVLDCTLRDGGYINNWNFKEKNINNIIKELQSAKLDIIECGFLREGINYDADKSIFDSLDRLKNVLPSTKGNEKYVAMINFGDFDINNIPVFDGSSIDGIRVAFHKSKRYEAIDYCTELAKKGYMTFIQPMVTINYSDAELLELVKLANEFEPYAFYIADSFGMMKSKDIMRMFYLIDNNLKDSIKFGYHGHNNMQLAFSNAKSFIGGSFKRELLVDSSVFGMGRGAGNLNTELFIQHMNDYFDTDYDVYPLLHIIDSVLNKIYIENYWGYSLPHYLSATKNCHPNYATYLTEKNTLEIKSIQELLSKIPVSKKGEFDKYLIEDLYQNYQAHNIDDSTAIEQLRDKFTNKDILLIAPGKSIDNLDQSSLDLNTSKDIITISINFNPRRFNADYVFVSNKKRYTEISQTNSARLILTSNMKSDEAIQIDYLSLLNNDDFVSDNATLMALKLLSKLDVKDIYIAGFDGYSNDLAENYTEEESTLSQSKQTIQYVNRGVMKVLKDLRKELSLKFLTPSKYEVE